MRVVVYGLITAAAGALAWALVVYRTGSRKTRHQVAAEYERAITLAMLKVMMADGEIEPAEVKAVARTYRGITGRELSAEDIEEEADTIQSAGIDLSAALAEIAPYLSEEGKDLALRAAIRVAVADGAVPAPERALLGDIASSLGLSEAHLHDMLAEASAVR